MQLIPSSRLIASKKQVPYLGVVLSYQDYEIKTIRQRLAASKARTLKEVAHAVRNSRSVTERHRRKCIWRITAWASAIYGLHVVGSRAYRAGSICSRISHDLSAAIRSEELLPGHT